MIAVTCQNCKTIFKTRKRGDRRIKFCSRSCCAVSKLGGEPWNKGTKGVMRPNAGSFQKGKKHRFWKGVDTHYLSLPTSKRVNGSYYVHRHVMEEALGRKLKKTEHVHHMDGNKRNNDLKNLVVLSRYEHGKLHRQQQLVKRF